MVQRRQVDSDGQPGPDGATLGPIYRQTRADLQGTHGIRANQHRHTHRLRARGALVAQRPADRLRQLRHDGAGVEAGVGVLFPAPLLVRRGVNNLN